MQDRDYHTFHTSYTLLWLQSLMQYYDYTGDRPLSKSCRPMSTICSTGSPGIAARTA